MGIPGFLRALRTAFPKARLFKRASNPCDAIYIDCNSYIHPVANTGRVTEVLPEDYDRIIADIIAAVGSLIEYYQPRKLIYLAIDGPAPMSKVQEQRERRYLSAINREKGDYTGDFISPGTDFMRELDAAIRREITPRHKYSAEKLIYSSRLMYGEGEHKIMDYIRTHKTTLQSYSGSHVICGNDTDLILLGLRTGLDRLYISKDNVALYDSDGLPLVALEDEDRTSGRSNSMEFSISALRTELRTFFDADREDDFIFCCSLLGNDFLPRPAIMSDIVTGLQAILNYLLTDQPVMEDQCLSLFTYMEQQETMTVDGTLLSKLQRKHSEGVEQILEAEIDPTKMLPKYPFFSRVFTAVAREAPENHDDAFRYHWYTKFFLYGGFTEKSVSALAKASVEYIRGLFWVYDYYTLGQNAVTWLWYYPYHHVPLVTDLRATVEAVDSEDILGGPELFTDTTPVQDETRYTPLHQLVSIMPLQSMYLVPEELRFCYTELSAIIPFMPLTVLVNNEMIEVEYMTKAIIPKVSYLAVMETLASRPFKNTFLAKYNMVSVPVESTRRPKITGVRDTNASRMREDRESTRESVIVPSVNVGQYVRESGAPSSRGRGVSWRGDSRGTTASSSREIRDETSKPGLQGSRAATVELGMTTPTKGRGTVSAFVDRPMKRNTSPPPSRGRGRGAPPSRGGRGAPPSRGRGTRGH